MKNEVWAGWFQNGPGAPITRDAAAQALLVDISNFDNEAGDVGSIFFPLGAILLDETDFHSPILYSPSPSPWSSTTTVPAPGPSSVCACPGHTSTNTITAN